jgi:hypothetical protein
MKILNRCFTLLFVFWLSVFASVALAQTPPAPAPAPVVSGMSTTDQILVNGMPDITFIRDAMMWLSTPTELVTMNLLYAGTHLLMAIAALSFAFLSIKMMLEASSYMDYLGQFINGLIMYGMVEWVLHNYTSGTGGGLIVLFNQGFDQAIMAMLGITNAADIQYNVWAGFMADLKIANMLVSSLPINNGMSLATLIGAVTALQQPYVVMLDLFMMACAWITLLAGGVLFVGIYIYSMMLFAVGMMLGPIMLPWTLLKPFSFVGEGWIKYMVMAGFYRVVGMAIIHINEYIAMGIVNAMGVRADTISGTAIKSIPTFAKFELNSITQWPQHLVLSAMAFCFGLLTLYMLSKVGEITQALLSGSGNAGLQFSGHNGLASMGGGGSNKSSGTPSGGSGNSGSLGAVAAQMGAAAAQLAGRSGGASSAKSAMNAVGAAAKAAGNTKLGQSASSKLNSISTVLSNTQAGQAIKDGGQAARSVIDAARPASKPTNKDK